METRSRGAAPSSGSRWPHALRSLAKRDLRLFFGGQAVSLAGTWMQSVAQAWLVWRLTRSTGMLGVVNFLGQVPVFLFGVWAGSIADRHPRRRIVLFTLAHSPRVFVEKCDFVTSAAKTPQYPWRRGGPTRLVTPLCTMEYDTQAGEWRLLSLHPGVSFGEAQKETGFPLSPSSVPVTPAPSEEDIALLRAQIPALRNSYPVFAQTLEEKIRSLSG